MVTMREVVEDALEDISVKTAETPLTSDELQSGIRRVNDMLTEWADIGLTPGYIEVLNGDDVINVDRNAIGAIKTNAAIMLAPSFQKVVSNALVKIASDKLATLEASVSYIGPVAYPDTLPLGSGNDCGNFYDDNRFFPENKTENF
jgi:hypothetical protein